MDKDDKEYPSDKDRRKKRIANRKKFRENKRDAFSKNKQRAQSKNKKIKWEDFIDNEDWESLDDSDDSL